MHLLLLPHCSLVLPPHLPPLPALHGPPPHASPHPPPPPRHQPNQTSCSPTPPTRLSGLSQIQKHPCLPFLGGYSQHSQSPQWVEPVHPSLLPHCSLSSNHASLKKIVWDRQKDSLPEAPPVPSDVAAPSSWGSAARRQPLNKLRLCSRGEQTYIMLLYRVTAASSQQSHNTKLRNATAHECMPVPCPKI